jgi:hypothetical protein
LRDGDRGVGVREGVRAARVGVEYSRSPPPPVLKEKEEGGDDTGDDEDEAGVPRAARSPLAVG